MRVKRNLLAVLVALCVCAGSVFAENELWSDEYYRAYDYTDELSELMRDDLDEECVGFIERYQLDLVLRAVTEDDLEGMGEEAFAQELYDQLGFGYGEGRDGFLWLYITDRNEVEVFCFGAAEGRIEQDFLDFAASASIKLAEEHGVYGVLYGGVRYLSNYLDDHPVEPGGASERESAADTPPWYPEDPERFSFFHVGEKAPRVVDAADIFTAAEERGLEARVGELRRELQKDLVIYTDSTDYGLGHDICAADFYDYSGYGCGDDYEGVCLFICMDPDNRGWWCCCTGPETKGLYTEEIANLMDDALYEYMVDGAYAEGVADWVENFRRLYVKGAPFAPEWYPEAGAALTPFHSADAPRVVDELGLLTEPELAELTAQAAAIAQKYGVDVAIHTMESPWGLDYDEVSRAYYTHMGYGVGENYDGILLNVFKREGYYATSRITGFGSVNDRLSEVNHERMWNAFNDHSDNARYAAGAAQWLRQVDHMLRTGRVARSSGYWALIAFLGTLCGSIFGGVALWRAKAAMAVPVEKTDADAYFDGSSRISDAGRELLYSTTSRRYDPEEEPSSRGSSGGSSHRSSYSSSYRGSSGRSHSGSGRRF